MKENFLIPHDGTWDNKTLEGLAVTYTYRRESSPQR